MMLFYEIITLFHDLKWSLFHGMVFSQYNVKLSQYFIIFSSNNVNNCKSMVYVISWLHLAKPKLQNSLLAVYSSSLQPHVLQ